jgi:arginine metabolism regulation protein II
MDARLLHHMYSYLRVTSESIGIRLQVHTDDPTREFNEPPEKNGMFCLATECYDVGLDSEEVKTPDLGYTDIHLQVQGKWHKSL